MAVWGSHNYYSYFHRQDRKAQGSWVTWLRSPSQHMASTEQVYLLQTTELYTLNGWFAWRANLYPNKAGKKNKKKPLSKGHLVNATSLLSSPSKNLQLEMLPSPKTEIWPYASKGEIQSKKDLHANLLEHQWVTSTLYPPLPLFSDQGS